MRKLPALGQTCGWVRTSGSHLQEACALLPEAPLQLPLGMESSAKLHPGSGDYRDSSAALSGKLSTVPLSAFSLGYGRAAEGTVTQERETREETFPW